MARRQITDLAAWPSLSLEGNLIAPAMIARIDRREADEQDERDYGVRKGLTVREEVALAFRVGQAHFDAFARIEAPSMEATRRFMRSFLAETFGFGDLADGTGAVAFVAGGRVPIVVVPSSEALDRRSETLSTGRSRSPALALQDYLNEHDEALWGLATNGTTLRLMRDNASLTRPAHIEADLAQIFDTEDAASFAALWLMVHRSCFGASGAPSPDCALERWRDTGAREGEAARDRLAGQVEIALRVLGTGFLEANPDLATRLRSGELSLTDWFNELLRLVYRLIFLMVAEDRNLLHPAKAGREARQLYSEGYSLAALRTQCVRRASWDRYHDRYEAMKIVFRALADGEAALALPALGGLFEAGQLSQLASARLRNDAFMEAVYRLSWLVDKSGLVPVNWRAMETEELGSVYESLLELQPQLADDGRAFVFASGVSEQKGNQRKTTGSYYTPDSLVQTLLDTALDPVLDRAESEAEDPAEALLGLTVIDPACGSGHFLLAAARRIATRLARIRAEGTPSLADYRHALRDAVRNCVHGVDRNPMAVELTKVALWIETVDPGLPLGFLDAQIRCGDALLGVFDLAVLERGIPDAAYKALTGDDKPVARHYAKKNKGERSERARIEEGFRFSRQRDLMRDFAAMRAMPEDTLDQIAAKSKRLNALTGSGADSWILARACDLYVAAFLTPKIVLPTTAGSDGLPRRGAETVPTSGTVWEYLRGVRPFGLLVQNAERALDDARPLHWPLEFPDIMARGGFDVVLGNPPWEVMQLSEKEYFATRKPEIAALTGAARKRAISDLEDTDPAAFQDYVAAKRMFDAGNQFARESGRFDRTARGKVNTYSLFAELFSNLARDRAGVIVPTGIATDATTAAFFAAMVEDRRLANLVDFENSAPLFGSVHRSYKFCLLTVGRNEGIARFAFFLTDPAQLAEPERNFTLSADQIAAINPNTRTAPVFRSRADAELTAKIYANVPVLIDESKGREGNPWGVEFRQGLFNMTSDYDLFHTARQLAEADFVRDGTDWVRAGYRPPQGMLLVEGTDSGSLPLAGAEVREIRYVPLYEAKMFEIYNHRASDYRSRGDSRGHRVLPALNLDYLRDPEEEVIPFYWVPLHEVEARCPHSSFLAGYGEATTATTDRTCVMTIFPYGGVGHKTILVKSNVHMPFYMALIANCNTLFLDFLARTKVSYLTLAQFIFKQLPILPIYFYTEFRLDFVVPRLLELTYTSYSLRPFARDLGYSGPPFTWDEERRARLRAELDAFYARAYRLTRDEVRYILDPTDVMGPDYPSETFRVLKDKEIRQFGEYRTRRLVLAAWDRMEASGEFRELGL